MKYIYFDAASGISGDMTLGALLDLGVKKELFKTQMLDLGLPVEIQFREVKRAGLRGLKVNVKVHREKTLPRKWKDVATLIENSHFSPNVKKRALEIFKTLFTAEAYVHGHSFQNTHLHEAGADDAIIDILGSSFLFEALDIQEFYTSPLNLGAGRVKAAHGSLPVPAPAVAEILKGLPVYSAVVSQELVTPTGAAIVATLTQAFPAMPELCYEKIGYGAGGKNFPDFPNILRVFYGEQKKIESIREIFQIEANVDDSNPQILANALEILLKKGALDAYLTPVVMKKNRLASKLTVLTESRYLDILINTVFEETSSIGVRFFPVKRHILPRQFIEVKVLGEPIKIKVATSGDQIVNIQPEFKDCQRVARKNKMPVKKILALALHAYTSNHSHLPEREV